MERFIYRQINLADIAAAVGKNTTELQLTAGEDGVVAVDVPDLTVAQRSALRALFTDRGYVEDATALL